MLKAKKKLNSLKEFFKKYSHKEVSFVVFKDKTISYKPLYVYQGAFLFVVLVASLLITANLFFPTPKLNPALLIKEFTTKQLTAVTAGSTPKLVHWITVVKRTDITQDNYLLRLPKKAKNIKVITISKQTAQQIQSQPTPKADTTLTLEARQQLAKISTSNNHSSFLAGLSSIARYLIGDIEEAVSDVVEQVQETINPPVDQPEITETKDEKVVDLSKEEKKEEKQEEKKEEKKEESSSAEATADEEETIVEDEEYVQVEFDTPSPDITEQNTDTGKLVTVTADPSTETPETPITDVLAFTTIPEIYKVGQEDKIKIKWSNNGNQQMQFTAYDLNNNGKLDYIEWTVPHLSEQIFEIIFISKAFRLDSNREITEDIYEYVQAKDNNWTTLNNGEYIRATFEQTLNNTKDVTLYAKPAVEGQSVSVEVWAQAPSDYGSNDVYAEQLVAVFENIDHEDTYKVLLTDLQTPTDVFDLRITGNIDFDWVVDPSSSSGPNNPGTEASVSIEGMYDGWYDHNYSGLPVDAGTENGVDDLSTPAGNETDGFTGYLKVTNFGFSIPAGATIDGIVVEVKKANVTDNNFYDYRARIVKGGVIGSTDRSSLNKWPASLTYVSYGASDDKWGEDWTQADINASTFGFAISVKCDNGNGGCGNDTVDIDHIRITVYYTPDTTPAVPSSFSPASASTITDSTPTITFTTDENADCFASADGDETYDGMADDTDCTGDGTTSQSCTLADLGDAGNKNVYVACKDTAGNEDTADTNEDLTYKLVDTSGPNSPGTVSATWANYNNVKTEDGNVAYASTGEEDIGLCLSGNALVSTENGSKEIKDLKQGDLVYSYNNVSQNIELKEVGGVFNRSISFYGNKYYHIYFEGGDIRATYNHYFYVGEKLKTARDLVAGDVLFDINGQQKRISNIVIEENYTDEVWDISVKDNYNFFANGVLVHNVGATYDKYVKIIKSDGSLGTTNKADATAWGGTLSYIPPASGYYGETNDLWGESWTASDINDSDFGVAISAYGSGYSGYNLETVLLNATNFGFSIPAGSTIDGIKVEVKKKFAGAVIKYAQIDYIKITVYYTPAPDSTPPVPSSFSPASASTITDTTQTITFTTDENATCYLSLDGDEAYADMSDDTLCSGGGTTSQSCTTPDLGADGAKNVYVACTDGTNADTADTNELLTYTLDTTAPVPTVTAVGGDAASTWSTSDTTPLITLTTNENADCYASETDEAYDDMSTDVNCTGDGTQSISCQFVSALAESASKTIYVACKDTATNKDTIATNEAITMEIDATPPTTSGYDPANSSTIEDTTPTITFTTNENGDCFASADGDETYDGMSDDTNCTGDGTTSHSCTMTDLGADGTKTIYIACKDDTDATNNKDTADTNDALTYTLSTNTAPTLTSISDSPDPIKGGNTIIITPSGQADADSNALYFYCNESGSATSANTLCSQANASYSTPYSTMTCTYAVTTGDATRTVYCRTYDGTDYGTERTTTYLVDTTVATPSSFSPASGTTITTNTPTITFTTSENADCRASLLDDSYDLASDDVDCTGDGTTSQTCVMTTLGADGAKTVYIACKDTAGNKDTNATNEELTYTLDTTPPAPSSFSPASASTITTNTPTITFTTNEAADCRASTLDDSYDLASDDVDCTGDGTTSQTCVMTTLAPDGAKTVYIACKDTAGNKDTNATNEELAYTLDTTPPAPSSFSPASASTISDTTQDITFTTNENATCKVSLTDQAYGAMTGDACTGGGTTSQSCTTPDLGTDGAKNVYIACTDSTNADTADTNENLSYTLSTTANIPTNLAFTNVTSNLVSLSWTANENPEGTTYYVENTTAETNSGWLSTLYWTSQGLTCGTAYTFKVKARNIGETHQTDYVYAFTQTANCGGSSGGSSGSSSASSTSESPSVVETITNTVQEIVNIPTNIVDTVVEQITNIVDIFIPSQADQQIALPPVEEVVPQIPQEVFVQPENILTPTELQEIALLPLPESVKELAIQFPGFKTTLDKVDVNTQEGIGMLNTANLVLPSLSQVAQTQEEKTIDSFTAEEKQRIPSNIVFARIGENNIDLNINISFTENTEAIQNITTIQGKSLYLAVKPDQPAKDVKGQLVLVSTNTTQKQTNKKTAGLIEAVNAQTDNNQQKQLTLGEFDYQDQDKDGIYTALFSSPAVDGKYQIKTTINYKEKTTQPKELSMVLVVDPEGYIYEKTNNKETRIPNAIVSIYKLNQETNEYELWLAQDFQQKNPQTTDNTGRYSFLVPQGSYYLKVTAKDYTTYQGSVFEVTEGRGIHENIELKLSSWWKKIFSVERVMMGIVVILLICVLTFLIINKRK